MPTSYVTYAAYLYYYSLCNYLLLIVSLLIISIVLEYLDRAYIVNKIGMPYNIKLIK